MAKTYFRQLPDFDYVNRTSENRNISAYETVKNIFKRAKISDDIFSDLTFFTKYKIVGDDRPDIVANKFYDDPRLDWIVLLSNNIMNVQTEWPMTQSDYYDFLIDKYGDEETINKVHHHRCTGVTTNDGIVIVPEGLTIESDFSVTYFDASIGSSVTKTGISEEVTNLEYENDIQDAKRNIFLLKPTYLNVVFDDIEDLMRYKKGGTQYVSPTLKRGDNIRLYG